MRRNRLSTTAVLFVLLVGMCALIVLAGLIDEVPSQRGLAHPEYPTMMLGGAPEARHGSILWLGWAFGAMAIALFQGLIDWSLSRGGGADRVHARRGFFAGGLCLQAAFLALVLSYRGFMEDPLGGGLVLGFPAPSAWMMYGVWGAPLILVLLYVWRFESWIWSAADEEEFHRLVKAYGDGRGAAGDER